MPGWWFYLAAPGIGWSILQLTLWLMYEGGESDGEDPYTVDKPKGDHQ